MPQLYGSRSSTPVCSSCITGRSTTGSPPPLLWWERRVPGEGPESAIRARRMELSPCWAGNGRILSGATFWILPLLIMYSSGVGRHGACGAGSSASFTTGPFSRNLKWQRSKPGTQWCSTLRWTGSRRTGTRCRPKQGPASGSGDRRGENQALLRWLLPCCGPAVRSHAYVGDSCIGECRRSPRTRLHRRCDRVWELPR